MGWRVTIGPVGKHPLDGRFVDPRRDSAGRVYREFTYKSDANRFMAELVPLRLDGAITSANKEATVCSTCKGPHPAGFHDPSGG